MPKNNTPNDEQKHEELSIDQPNPGVISLAKIKEFIQSAENPAVFTAHLSGAQSLADLKNRLKDQGITNLGWITPEHHQEINRAIRERSFISIINEHSPVILPRPQLLKAFQSLTNEQQTELLTKKDELRHLINLQDKSQVAYYFGKDVKDELAKALIDENRQSALYGQIYNAAVADVLARNASQFILTEEMVTEINKWLGICTGMEFDIEQNQKLLSAFLITSGVSKDFFKPNPQDWVKIKEQHSFNFHLFDGLNGPATVKPLIGAYLAIKKEQKTVPNSVNVLTGNLDKVVENDDSLSDFIKKRNGVLTKSLTKHLTPAAFEKIKEAHRTEKLKSPETSKPILKSMRNQLNIIRGLNKISPEGLHELTMLNSVSYDYTFASPEFQLKAQEPDFESAYKAKAQHFELLLKAFYQDQATIESYQRSLTKPKQNEALNKALTVELDNVRKNIALFKGAHIKIRDEILPAIANAKKGGKQFDYVGGGETKVTCAVVKAGEAMPELAIHTPQPEGKQVKLSLEPMSKQYPFITQDKTPIGSTKVYDVAYDNVANNAGRFTEQRIAQGWGGAPGPGTYAIQQFPSSDDVKAKVNFAMVMSAQALANFEGKPSKEKPIFLSGDNKEQVQYLWAALQAHGVKEEAISINNRALMLDTKVGSGSYFIRNKTEGTLFWEEFKANLSQDYIKKHVDQLSILKTRTSQKSNDLYKFSKKGLSKETLEELKKPGPASCGDGDFNKEELEAYTKETPPPLKS